MSVVTNKAFVKRYFEQVWIGVQPDLLAEFWDEDFVYHGGPANLEELKTGLTTFLNTFAEVRFTNEDIIAEGDKVVVRWTLAANHQGEFMGVPATGKQVSFSGITIFRLANNQIVEAWVRTDDLGLMQQLGAIPTPETS